MLVGYLTDKKCWYLKDQPLENVPPTWFSLYGLRWWEAQTARMTIMISRAPQEARMAIRVLLSAGFFK